MDPNNNQPINTNPFGQPVQQDAPAPVQPMQQPSSAPTPTVVPPPVIPTAAPEPMPQAPKNSSRKGIILLIILLILVLGMIAYVLFVKNRLNTAQKAATDNTSTVIPTTTAPTTIPATAEEINVASPDADLKAIEDDVQGL